MSAIMICMLWYTWNCDTIICSSACTISIYWSGKTLKWAPQVKDVYWFMHFIQKMCAIYWTLWILLICTAYIRHSAWILLRIFTHKHSKKKKKRSVDTITKQQPQIGGNNNMKWICSVVRDAVIRADHNDTEIDWYANRKPPGSDPKSTDTPTKKIFIKDKEQCLIQP